jgi:hypothetical protein
MKWNWDKYGDKSDSNVNDKCKLGLKDGKNESKRDRGFGYGSVFRQLSNLTDCRFRLLPAKTLTCVPLAAIETRSSLAPLAVRNMSYCLQSLFLNSWPIYQEILT